MNVIPSSLNLSQPEDAQGTWGDSINIVAIANFDSVTDYKAALCGSCSWVTLHPCKVVRKMLLVLQRKITKFRNVKYLPEVIQYRRQGQNAVDLSAAALFLSPYLELGWEVVLGEAQKTISMNLLVIGLLRKGLCFSYGYFCSPPQPELTLSHVSLLLALSTHCPESPFTSPP